MFPNTHISNYCWAPTITCWLNGICMVMCAYYLVLMFRTKLATSVAAAFFASLFFFRCVDIFFDSGTQHKYEHQTNDGEMVKSVHGSTNIDSIYNYTLCMQTLTAHMNFFLKLFSSISVCVRAKGKPNGNFQLCTNTNVACMLLVCFQIGEALTEKPT